MLPEEVAAHILAETVHRRASMRSIAMEFFSRQPSLDYMKPIVRVLTLGVARNFLLLDHILSSLGYGPPSHSKRWMLARILAYEALKGKIKRSRLERLALKADIAIEDILRLKNSNPRDYLRNLGGLDKLSVLYSFPRWILEELAEAKIENLPKLLEALNKDPVRWIRVKPGIDHEQLKKSLERQGVIVEFDSDLPDVARIVDGASRATMTNEYHRGLYVIQDKASSLVGYVATHGIDKAGIKPIGADVTAGAFMKASHLAWLGLSYVVGSDVKLQRLREGKLTIKRLRLEALSELVVADGRKPPLRNADVVIVDPPCSDIGRLQYEPEVKMWLTRGDVKFFRRLQYQILHSVAEVVGPRTRIIYSVCTLTRSETFWVVRKLITSGIGIELEAAEPFVGERTPQTPGAQRLLPHIHKTQGFYIAKLVKL